MRLTIMQTLRACALAATTFGMAVAAPAARAAELPAAHPPSSELVFEIICDLAPTLSLGESPIGERRMVPIVSSYGAMATSNCRPPMS